VKKVWAILGICVSLPAGAAILYAGKIIGLQIAVPDFDAQAGQYHAYHTTAGSAFSWMDAGRFVDGRLLPAPSTSVAGTTWARIKAGFR
jgi:hypothetical protein